MSGEVCCSIHSYSILHLIQLFYHLLPVDAGHLGLYLTSDHIPYSHADARVFSGMPPVRSNQYSAYLPLLAFLCGISS